MKSSPKKTKTQNNLCLLFFAAISLGWAISGEQCAGVGFLLFLWICNRLPLWCGKIQRMAGPLFLFYLTVSLISLGWIFESIFKFSDRPLKTIFLSVLLLLLVTIIRMVIHAGVLFFLAKIFRIQLAGELVFPWIRLSENLFFSQVLSYGFLGGSLVESSPFFESFRYFLPLFGLSWSEAILWQIGGLLIFPIRSRKCTCNDVLPVFLAGLFFVGLFLGKESILESKKIKILPVSASDLTIEDFLTRLNQATQKISEPENTLVIFPETALRKNILFGDSLLRIRAVIEEKSFGLVLGANQIRPSPEGVFVFNSAFFFTPENFYDHSSKIFLVPLAESLPNQMFSFLPDLLHPDESAYHRGVLKTFNFGEIKIIPAICFDALIPEWYEQTATKNADFVIVLSRETRFGPLTKNKIERISKIYSEQFLLPLLKVADGAQNFYYSNSYKQDLVSGEEVQIRIPVRREKKISAERIIVFRIFLLLWMIFPFWKRSFF